MARSEEPLALTIGHPYGKLFLCG